MTRILSVAIVGCGIIGANHARAIVRHPGLELVALVDAAPNATARLGDLIVDELAQPRPREASTLAAALSSGAIDLVVICTPSGTHVGLAGEALAAGVHVVIEKPLDVNLPRAREIAAIAKDAAVRGLVVSVISQHRFDPASVVIAEAIARGDFGRITSAVASVAWWRTQEYYDMGEWRGTWELDGGGALMNQGVHTVDLLLWFLGRPIEIMAYTALLAHDRIEVEDTVAATVRFESGALAVLHATTAAYPELSVRLQVHGTQGSAIIDDDQLEYFHSSVRPGLTPGNQAAGVVPASELRGGERGADKFVRGHLRQYEDVVEAIRTGRAPGVTVADATTCLAVVRAVYLSATLGAAIRVDEVLDGSYDDVVVAPGVTA